MAPEVQPAALAALIAFAERPRIDDWSLRAALMRYAQPQPRRVGEVLELIRRIENAIGAQQALIAEDGPALWPVIQSAERGQRSDMLVGLLRATMQLDQLGDALAAWAVDRTSERPDAMVDAVTADVARRLDELGVPREERQTPTLRRG